MPAHSGLLQGCRSAGKRLPGQTFSSSCDSILFLVVMRHYRKLAGAATFGCNPEGSVGCAAQRRTRDRLVVTIEPSPIMATVPAAA